MTRRSINFGGNDHHGEPSFDPDSMAEARFQAQAPLNVDPPSVLDVTAFLRKTRRRSIAYAVASSAVTSALVHYLLHRFF